MNCKSNTLMVVLLLVALGYLALYAGVLPSLLHIVLGVLVVAVLPGYLLSEIFFPYLKNTQRLTLSLGLSFVFVILLGFGLHLAGFGLVREMWLAGSFYSSLVLGIFALIRTTQHDSLEDAKPLAMPKLHEPFLLLVAAGIMVAAVAMASGSSQRERAPITQLWILPQGHSTQGQSNSVEVGVVSNDLTTFRLEITGDGETLFDELVVIQAAKAKVIPLELQENFGLENYSRLEATLYKTDSSIPYRRVVLW